MCAETVLGARPLPRLLLPVCVGFENDPDESVPASEALVQKPVAGGHRVGSFFFLSSELNGIST